MGEKRTRTHAVRALDTINVCQQRLDAFIDCWFPRRQIVFFLPADTEQTLLQLPIRGERSRLHHPVDAAIDHDGDVIGDAGRHADILFDHEDRHRALLGELHQHGFDLLDDHRREPFGRLVHDQQVRITQKRTPDRKQLLLATGQLGPPRWCAAHKPRNVWYTRSMVHGASGPPLATRRRCSSTERLGQTRRPCGT